MAPFRRPTKGRKRPETGPKSLGRLAPIVAVQVQDIMNGVTALDAQVFQHATDYHNAKY